MPAKRDSARAGTQGDKLTTHMPLFVSKLSPEQWAECRRLRAEGLTYPELSERFGVSVDGIGQRARKEGWSGRGGTPATAPAPRKPSPGTIETRRRLAHHLYGYLEIRITM